MSNTFIRKEDQSSFKKSIFTLCEYRKNDKGENVLPGLYKPAKCYMIIKRKLSIMITR